jgi:hypothetical protein
MIEMVINVNKNRKTLLIVCDIFDNPHMIIIEFRGGAVGAGATSPNGSGFTKIMRHRLHNNGLRTAQVRRIVLKT